MAFSYHPPTRDFCVVCEELQKKAQTPIITSENGKASSANNFSFHNWYNFVLGYSPEFPDYILQRECINDSHFVVDPFMGSGTTLVACKQKGIPSAGIDANDYFFDVVKIKTNWTVNTKELNKEKIKVLYLAEKVFNDLSLTSSGRNKQLFLFDESFEDIENENLIPLPDEDSKSIEEYVLKNRTEMLTERYISDKPFVKAHILKRLIDKHVLNYEIKKLLTFAVSFIIVPISNVRYGPGFGIGKPKEDADILGVFKNKVDRIISDIENIPKDKRETPTDVKFGDTRKLSNYFEPNSIDLMITSPPYPGDHEYTKHTRLELLFLGYTDNKQDFRKIKKRMIRGSTTNVYKADNDSKNVQNFNSIRKVTDLIDKRLKKDGATSGFEKLYTKLVWEYFGGMYLTLKNVFKVLKDNGKICLLVSDSHAFKMVHIETAKILAEIGKEIGYKSQKIDLWQEKLSTSHKYLMEENILTLTK